LHTLNIRKNSQCSQGSGLLLQRKTFPAAAFQNLDTFDHQYQVRPRNIAGYHFLGQWKGAAFKSLVVQNKAAWFPMQHFHMRTSSVEKDKNLSAGSHSA
jgi:hypothetical protein